MKKILIRLGYGILSGLAASLVIANGMSIHDLMLMKAKESCEKKKAKEEQKKMQKKAD